MPNEKPKILIVEDNEDLVKMYEITFISEGFEVTACLNGLDGITKAVEIKPNVILLDLMMPQMNGYEVLTAMRKNTSMKVPIFVNSNISQQKDIDRALQLGANYYLKKADYTPSELAAKVEELLGMTVKKPSAIKESFSVEEEIDEPPEQTVAPQNKIESSQNNTLHFQPLFQTDSEASESESNQNLAPQTLASQSLPNNIVNENLTTMEQKVLHILLPEKILAQFEIMDVCEDANGNTILLEERNIHPILPDLYKDKTVHPAGFLPTKTLEGSLFNISLHLSIQSRRWQPEGTQNYFVNDIVSKDNKIVLELKEVQK